MNKRDKYNRAGVTLLNTNQYFATVKEAAEFIGVTPSAISRALKEDRPCQGWNLAYGNILEEEKKDDRE